MYLRNVVDFQRTTWRYIPEDITPHNYSCENMKSYMVSFLPSEHCSFLSRVSSFGT
jgi:hypothetical protein